MRLTKNKNKKYHPLSFSHITAALNITLCYFSFLLMLILLEARQIKTGKAIASHWKILINYSDKPMDL